MKVQLLTGCLESKLDYYLQFSIIAKKTESVYITSDNGKEFAEHEAMAKALAARFYFTHPYASWERGVNENTNGLIRQYFPKKMDFNTITQNQLNTVMNKLNHLSLIVRIKP